MLERTGTGLTETELQARKLAENLRLLGIRALLCDLDDTFLETTQFFHEKIHDCARMIAERTGKETAQIAARIFEESAAVFSTEYVNPRRWETIMSRIVPLEASLREKGLGIMKRLYTETPPLKEGAEKTLSILRYLGEPISTAIVTHANQAWTELKVKALGLKSIFGHIMVIDEDGPKGTEQWSEVITTLGFQPREVAVIGDSLKSDIAPAETIGAGLLVWVNGGKTWDFYQEGEVPERAIVVPEIGDLVDVLTNHWSLQTRLGSRFTQSGPFVLDHSEGKNS